MRERRRVARILLVLAVLFAMCWLPYNVMMLAMDLLDLEVDTQQWLLSVSAGGFRVRDHPSWLGGQFNKLLEKSVLELKWTACPQLLPFTLLLGHCNSAINPLLYCFMTRNFRRTVRGLFARRRPRALGSRPQQRCKVSTTTVRPH